MIKLLSYIYSHYTHLFTSFLSFFISHNFPSFNFFTNSDKASLQRLIMCSSSRESGKAFSAPERKMKSKIKHIQLNRVQFFVGKDKRQKELPTTCSARPPASHSLRPPAGSQTQSPSGCCGVAGGSQPPKGEKLYRYNGIAERTIRCVFARRFDCYCCCCSRFCC